MDNPAKKTESTPRELQHGSAHVCESNSKLAFENLEAFSKWLTQELAKLETTYSSFSTVNSFRSFIGR